MSSAHICSEVSLLSPNESSYSDKLGRCNIKTEVLDYQDDSLTINHTDDTFNFVELKTEPDVQDCVKLEVVDEHIDYTESKTEAATNLREEKVDKFRCGHCNHISKTKAALEVHRHVKHPETTMLMCKQCDFVTDTQMTLERHVIIMHEKRKLFKCELCPFKSIYYSNVCAHFRSLHKRITHNCRFCDYSAKRKSRLQKHEKTHHEINKCPLCTWSSLTQSSLRSHMRQKHCVA